jgi:hypothetical protein
VEAAPAARRWWHRRRIRAFGEAFAPGVVLMLLVAAAAADRGGAFPLVMPAVSAAALGLLALVFPHGPQFALGAATGLAMYACLYVVIGRAAFPALPDRALILGYALPVVAFVALCWVRRGSLRRVAQRGEHAADLRHLPRFARWLGACAAVGVLSLSTPVNRLDPEGQGLALVGAMALIAAISAVAVGDVVRLLVDVAVIFRAVTRRLAHLAVPIAAYTSLWALLAVIFGCLYRVADGLSPDPLFGGAAGPVRLGFADALHFSVVTLSTVGYGDIMPRDDGVRLLASIQMLLAQLLLLFGFVEIMRGSAAGLADPAQAPPPPRASPARDGAAEDEAPPPPPGRGAGGGGASRSAHAAPGAGPVQSGAATAAPPRAGQGAAAAAPRTPPR